MHDIRTFEYICVRSPKIHTNMLTVWRHSGVI